MAQLMSDSGLPASCWFSVVKASIDVIRMSFVLLRSTNYSGDIQQQQWQKHRQQLE